MTEQIKSYISDRCNGIRLSQSVTNGLLAYWASTIFFSQADITIVSTGLKYFLGTVLTSLLLPIEYNRSIQNFISVSLVGGMIHKFLQ